MELLAWWWWWWWDVPATATSDSWGKRNTKRQKGIQRREDCWESERMYKMHFKHYNEECLFGVKMVLPLKRHEADSIHDFRLCIYRKHKFVYVFFFSFLIHSCVNSMCVWVGSLCIPLYTYDEFRIHFQWSAERLSKDFFFWMVNVWELEFMEKIM